jgi:RNA polymerase sigma factor (sigma-70 family)
MDAPVVARAAVRTDAQLVLRCREGDPAAWSEFVERFSRYVYAIAVRAYSLSQADAEEVFQDVFTRAYERLPELRDPSAVRAWLGQLTRRMSIDRIRGQTREELTEDMADEAAPDHEGIRGIEDALVLRDAMQALPEHCAEVLDRFFARDESYRTIGEALEIPAGTIASRISRCLTRLRTELGDISS